MPRAKTPATPTVKAPRPKTMVEVLKGKGRATGVVQVLLNKPTGDIDEVIRVGTSIVIRTIGEILILPDSDTTAKRIEAIKSELAPWAAKNGFSVVSTDSLE